jgi:hypothetical protein
MRARRLPYGNLMIPVIADDSGEVEGFRVLAVLEQEL